MLKYSKTQIRNAGDILKKKESYPQNKISNAEDLLTYWRTLHSLPINYLDAYIKIKVGLITGKTLIAKRIKRVASIINKLKRNKSTNLTSMQDIAGYRVIFNSIEEVTEFRNLLIADEKYPNHLAFQYEKNYITNPKESGYRGIHLIYKYTDKLNIDNFDSVYLELQLRTYIQHIWATAVETMSIFKNFSLKSGEGPQD